MARSEHHPYGLIHYNKQLAFRGYTLFSGNHTQAFLMDMEGHIVHMWERDEGITNPELLPNGNLMAMSMPAPDVAGQQGLNGQAGSCYELDWEGNKIWEYVDPWMHHDYQRLPNGDTLILKWHPLAKSLVRKIKGGYVADGDDPLDMLGDKVLIVSPEGELKKEWPLWEHLDPKTHLLPAWNHRKEWTHCNSISLTPKGNWLLSSRTLSTIFEVNPKSGKVKWSWGDGTTAAQHDVKYNSDDTITIFDNGIGRQKTFDYSRVLEIDAKSKEILWEYTDNPPFTFHTIMGGSVNQLPNGNMFICETAKGQFFEVTRDKKVVWEYINPFFVSNPRLGGRMNLVFRAHRYAWDHPGLKDKDLDPAKYRNLNRLYGSM